MTKSLRALLICIFSLVGSNAYAYFPIVSEVLGEVESTANSIINNGFDRLDRSMVNFGVELERSAHVFRETYDGILNDTIDVLDPAQKRIVEDFQTILTTIENTEIDQLNTVIDAQQETIDKIYALLSDTALVTKIKQVPLIEGDEYSHIKLFGASLNIENIKSINFNNEKVDTSTISESSNSNIAFKFSMPSLKNDNKERGVWFIPFEVVFETCGFWSFWNGCDVQTFRHSLLVFPKSLGTVTAMFSGGRDTISRRSVSRGPFQSPRVKSRLKTFGVRRGIRTDTHTATAASGWTIDVATSKYVFTPDYGGCNNSKARATWVRRDMQTLQVRTTTAADKKPGATCRTTTTIKYDEIQNDTVPDTVTIGGGDTQLAFDGETVLKLPDDSNLNQARLSHIMVVSPLIRDSQDNQIIITPNGNENFGYGAIKAKYLSASNSVYVSID